MLDRLTGPILDKVGPLLQAAWWDGCWRGFVMGLVAGAVLGYLLGRDVRRA